MFPRSPVRSSSIEHPRSPFSLTAASPVLHIELVAPDGRRYVVREQVQESATTAAGATYRATVANPVPGIWSIDVSGSVPPVSTIDVVVLCTFDNAIRLALAGAGDTYPGGRAGPRWHSPCSTARRDIARCRLALNYSSWMIRPSPRSASPSPTMGRTPTRRRTTASTKAFVNPGRAGRFQIQLDVEGVGSTGPFRRSAAGAIRVVDRTVDITAFTGRGVDLDHDGLIDEIVVSPVAMILEDGDYLVTARLRGSNGRDIERSVETPLTIGMRSADVVFDAEDILSDIGVDGPYHRRGGEVSPRGRWWSGSRGHP